MYNTTLFSVARRCEAEPSKTILCPTVRLTCEVVISPSASAQGLQSVIKSRVAGY
jgi:hypothetical protein